MIRAIFSKEWLKLKLFFAFLAVFILVLLAHYAYNLNFEFKTIEPETMMWYRFVALDYKTYTYFMWIMFLSSSTISLAQFLPERVKNRIKIITHLPISLLESLSLHVSIGFGIITALWIIFMGIGYSLLSRYYPYPITNVFLYDSFMFYLGSLMLYVGIASSILEQNQIVAVAKFILALLCVWIFSLGFSFLWIGVLIWLFLLSFDSILSIKKQRLKLGYVLISGVLGVLFLAYSGYGIYFDKFYHQLNKFYIFYSPIKKVFAFQRNFGKHQFEYGLENGEKFDRKTYESLLPFVYWADLDIQKKLPIEIDGTKYSKSTIKKARLSFSYRPKDLHESMLLYPFINSKKDEGIILFPEEMLYAKKDKFIIFSYDDNIDYALTKEVNTLAKKEKLSFPIQNIWGKSTNMKTYDLGYFIKDKNGNIFNLRRGDNKVTIRKIIAPKGIVYISINENIQKQLAGLAIDDKNQVYMIKWDDFSFIHVKLPNFNYKNMNLRFISNAAYYQIRYDDGTNYHSSVFDKNLNFISHVVLKAD